MVNEIAVSVVCNAYNHEKYIKKALDGFVMQKTSFTFEVLIHDDASTDGTAAIIRDYVNEYPHIFKPIYETENQYSKHDGSLVRIQYGRVKGKYTALCEGDDYWIDPLKLQKQYDVLESNPQIDICASATYYERDNTITGTLSPSKTKRVISPEEVILGGGGFVGTATIMYRSSMRVNPPEFFKMISLDYTIQILGSLRGGMMYLPDIMSVYRISTNGSWTERMGKDPEKQKSHNNDIEKMLVRLNIDTSGRYESSIQRKILRNQFYIACLEKRFREALSVKYFSVLKSQHPKVILKVVIGALSQTLHSIHKSES